MKEPVLKAVLFDWAGTMVDFGSLAPIEAMQAVFAEFGVALDAGPVRAGMGRAKREHVEVILRDGDVSAAWRRAQGRDASEADVVALMQRLTPALTRTATNHATLIPGAAATAAFIEARQTRIGSTTGYTTAMMAGILPAAAAQGYRPACVFGADDAPRGRPAPFLLWRAMTALEVFPARACVAVDDAPVGIEAGRNAGVWTVAVAASGNEAGVSLTKYETLSPAARVDLVRSAARAHERAGADYVIATVADLPALVPELERRIAAGDAPGGGRTILVE